MHMLKPSIAQSCEEPDAVAVIKGVTFEPTGSNAGRVKSSQLCHPFKHLSQVDARLSADKARDYPFVLPDKELLRAASTSPEHEAARYAGDVRRAPSYLLAAAARPGPPQAAPAYFAWEAGCRAWVQSSKPPAGREAARSCPVAVALAFVTWKPVRGARWAHTEWLHGLMGPWQDSLIVNCKPSSPPVMPCCEHSCNS